MLKIDLKMMTRNLLKYKMFTFLNLFGLIIGFTCSILILINVKYEKSYDRHFKNGENIYRVTGKSHNPEAGYSSHFARNFIAWIHTLPDEIPEIDKLVRFSRMRKVIQKDNIKFYEENFFHVDQNVFEVFGFTLTKGDPKTALKSPFSIVITEFTAKKYFHNEDPIGKKLNVLNTENNQTVAYSVTGIIEDIPKNSHIDIDFLASFRDPNNAQPWYYTYILLKPGTSPNEIEKKFPALIDKNIGPDASKRISFPLQKLTDIHLNSRLNRELKPNGNNLYVNILEIIAFLIICIAAINFINLSSARYTHRAKEIGVRKVLGAHRNQIAKYFLGESVLYSLTALIFSYFVITISFPLFKNLTDPNISLQNNWKLLLLFIPVSIVTGLLSGWYPALLLSSLQPVRTIRTNITGTLTGSKQFFSIRRILVILQFSISTALLVVVVFIFSQIRYIKNRDIGFKIDRIVTLDNIPDIVKRQYSVFKDELKKSPLISDVSAVMDVPSKEVLDAGAYSVEGLSIDPKNPDFIYVLPVDENIIDLLKLNLMAGHSFLPGAFSDTTKNTYILNESAVKSIGWQSPEEAIGKKFSLRLPVPPFQPKHGEIIGVVKDFNYADLRKKIKPMVLFPSQRFIFCILIKYSSEDLNKIIAFIREKWNRLFPDYPFEYSYLENYFNNSYKGDKKQLEIFSTFSLMAILIACLGLIGLLTFMLEKRAKEISIRKVFGASIKSIIILVLREFLILIAIATITGWIFGYYASGKWLQNFVYHTNAGFDKLIVSSVLIFGIALLTVGYQSVKAAITNPIANIREE